MKNHKTFKKALLFILFFSLLVIAAHPIQAEARSVLDSTKDPLIFQPQVGIPGVYEKNKAYELTENDTSYIAKMIKGFYNYGIGIAGILAAIMLMAGGLIWLTSGGSVEKITQAKNIMSGSIIGLVLLFGSWMLLRTINPELVDFNIRTIQGIKNKTLSDGEDGLIDGAGNLPPDTEISMKCLDVDQMCVDLDPPLHQLATSLCIDKFGYEEWSNFTSSCGSKNCCGSSQILDNELDKECANKENGEACKVTATDLWLSGVCKNNKCEGGLTCCQCLSGNTGLNSYLYKSCQNDLTPIKCREWCSTGNSIAGWGVHFYIGGSSKYNCSEGAFSQCTAK